MLIAPTRSALSSTPHSTHTNWSCVCRLSADTWPQHGQVRLVFFGGTATNQPPRHASLSSSCRRHSNYPCSRMDLFRPALADTFLPGCSAILLRPKRRGWPRTGSMRPDRMRIAVRIRECRRRKRTATTVRMTQAASDIDGIGGRVPRRPWALTTAMGGVWGREEEGDGKRAPPVNLSGLGIRCRRRGAWPERG